MTENETKRAEIMNGLMLNQVGIAKLADLGIYKELILALSLEDLTELRQNRVYLNPMFSPASLTELRVELPANSKVISIDINTLKIFTPDEGVAVILHEIGHALNPDKKGEIGEYVADDYAVSHSYKNSIISSLQRGIQIRPDEFDNEITHKRIARLMK